MSNLDLEFKSKGPHKTYGPRAPSTAAFQVLEVKKTHRFSPGEPPQLVELLLLADASQELFQLSSSPPCWPRFSH